MTDNALTLLNEIELLQMQVITSVDKPEEGQVRSATNELVAFKMGKFGKCVDDTEKAYLEESDNLDYLRESKKVDLMSLDDPETGKHYTATKAESIVELEPTIREQFKKVRSLRHSHAILKNKSKAMWAWLDNSRSRLSWLGREVHHGS